ncbi:phosphoserine phosphatase SerB [Acidicapsa ligni]|uniref:phosphoserine phosphatase SerB n=1 Tax=Acidicapsa ligni TaxID=542300 RepID=UPI00295A7FF6|nr:phosphoserine phosphatase SerB [Acidicapsa ligni]
MSETILIHYSGADRPGLTTQLTGILAEFGAGVLDIHQASVQGMLVLGLLIELPAGQGSESLWDRLTPHADALKLKVMFTRMDPEAVEAWVRERDGESYVATVMGREISALVLSRVAGILAEHGLNIGRIDELSGPRSLRQKASETAQVGSIGYACVEFHARGQVRAEAALRAELLALADELATDMVFQREDVFRRNRRMFVFDMDSTLIQGEVIDELAKMLGVGEQVSLVTAAAMRGEIEFQESFRRRVALLKGLPETRVFELLERIPLMEGAERLFTTLKRLGYKTAVLSGGFTFFGAYLKERLGVDYVFANELDIADGVVTGEVRGEIVDGARKAALLVELAEREGISLEQVVAVGDGANDLPMLKLAGMGVAFHAKPVVRAGAAHSLSYLGLDSLLYLVGVRDGDF